jgi:hypothetical protein
MPTCRYDYGIKETGAFCSAGLYHEHVEKFTALSTDVIIANLPVPKCRTMFNIEAKLGADGILRIVEINPFRACGAAPLLSSYVFGRNVFELAFAEKLEAVAPTTSREVLICYARAEGETASELAAAIVVGCCLPFLQLLQSLLCPFLDTLFEPFFCPFCATCL